MGCHPVAMENLWNRNGANFFERLCKRHSLWQMCEYVLGDAYADRPVGV